MHEALQLRFLVELPLENSEGTQRGAAEHRTRYTNLMQKSEARMGRGEGELGKKIQKLLP